MIVGSPLWRLGVPLVFGPAGSGQVAPREAAPLFGDAWGAERRRSAVVSMANLVPPARSTARNAALVLAPNQESAELARGLGARHIELMCDTGAPVDVLERTIAASNERRRRTSRWRVVWIGSLLPRKGVSMAIEAFGRLVHSVDAELQLLGTGPLVGDVQQLIRDLQLDDRVTVHGAVPWPEAQAILASCDVMLFTSLRETFGSQVLEAAAAGVPIVALDLHGVASLVPPSAAVKVPFLAPADAVVRLGDALASLLSDPRAMEDMSRGALRFAQQESWPARAARVTEIYGRIRDQVAVCETRSRAPRLNLGRAITTSRPHSCRPPRPPRDPAG
jgi:glycosyltransferase involved in cell wall biosynthesis